MLNNIRDIITAIKTRLYAIGIDYVDVYPDCLANIGNQYPFVIIKMINEENVQDNGGQLEVECIIDLYLFTQHGDDKLNQHCDTLYALQSAIYADTQLGGKVKLIYPVSVDWDASLPGVTDFMTQDAVMLSATRLNMLYFNTR